MKLTISAITEEQNILGVNDGKYPYAMSVVYMDNCDTKNSATTS